MSLLGDMCFWGGRNGEKRRGESPNPGHILSLSFVMVWAVLVGWQEGRGGGGFVAACLAIVS